MYLVESVTGINGKLPDLLVVIRVGVVGIALKGGDVGAADVVLHYVGPQPQLGVGVEGVAQDRDRVQSHHEVPDVLHLRLREGLRATVSLRAFVVTHARLPVVEAPVPVGIHALAAQDRAVLRPRLPPESVVLPAVGVSVRVGGGEEVPVDLVQVVGVLGVVLHQLVDQVGGDCRGDPLPGVYPGLQPDVGGPGPGLGDGQHLHVSPLVALSNVNNARPVVGVGHALDEGVEVSVRIVVSPVEGSSG